MESTGADGAGLTRHLHAAGLQVLEVNQPHPHTRRRRGKSDAIDAEAAARKALSGETTIIPKDTTSLVEAIRLGRVARGGVVEAYAAALGRLLVTAPEPLRRQVCSQPKTLKGRVAVCARLWPDPARLDDPMQAAKLALRATAEPAQASTSKHAPLRSGWTGWSAAPRHRSRPCLASVAATPASCCSVTGSPPLSETRSVNHLRPCSP